MIDTKRYRVAPGTKVKLSRIPSEDDGGLKREEGDKLQAKLTAQLRDLQERLYAGSQGALLVVLQAMDAGGKDSTTRRVFGPINPQGCRVVSFKTPTYPERNHDFLWRVHQHVPQRGYIAVFNRSHYEDILVVRVKKLVEQRRWKRRYDHINDFERMLCDEGTHILKFYLHISKAYQKERLQRRLARPDKHWKFNPGDLVERGRWNAYRQAFEDVFARCSTKAAPWYVVPAECRWYRNLVVAQTVVNTLKAMELKYPKPDFDPATVTID